MFDARLLRTLVFGTLVASASLSNAAPALPPEAPTPGPAIVELKVNGEVSANGMKAVAGPAEIKKVLVAERDRQERVAKLKRVPASPAIVIRADRDTPYAQLIELMDMAKTVGFVAVSLESAGRAK